MKAFNLPLFWILLGVNFATLTLHAQTVVQPASPQHSVPLTLPEQGGAACPSLTSGTNCIRSVPGGNATSLQRAINAASCGDTIILSAGSRYSGNFTIPATTCTGWIEIVSSSIFSLPASGNRVGPANVASMATVSSPNTSPAIRFLPNSKNWRLIGLEITTSYIDTVGTNFCLVSAGEQADGGNDLSVLSQLPANLIFDRIYIHGLADTNTKRGIQMDTQGIAVVDSYCDEIHYNGNDSQCFASWNGTGPYLIQNNFIQGGAENILFGGGDPSIPNLVPSDITISGNVFQKNPAWRAEAAPRNWVIKNLVELKNAQRVMIDGNVFQYIWAAGQTGYAFMLTPRNQNGNCAWCTVNDVTITHNLIRDVADGVTVASSDDNATSLPSARVLIQNNVFADVSAVNWGGHGWIYFLSVGSRVASLHDITLDHNTSFPDSMNGAMLVMGDSGAAQNVKVTNLLSGYGAYGIFGTGSSPGTSALSTYLPNYVYAKNVLITSNGSASGTYPSGTQFTSLAAVRFTNSASSNYQLQSTSPYHNAGTDGKDLGVWDWSCFNNRTAAALAGKFISGSGCSSAASRAIEPPSNLSATVQ
jgi:hypothetical protein